MHWTIYDSDYITGGCFYFWLFWSLSDPFLNFYCGKSEQYSLKHSPPPTEQRKPHTLGTRVRIHVSNQSINFICAHIAPLTHRSLTDINMCAELIKARSMRLGGVSSRKASFTPHELLFFPPCVSLWKIFPDSSLNHILMEKNQSVGNNEFLTSSYFGTARVGEVISPTCKPICLIWHSLKHMRVYVWVRHMWKMEWWIDSINARRS